MSKEIVELSELCDVITKGTTPSNIGAEFTEKGIKYIRSEMLTSAKYISDEGLLYISEETHKKLKRSQLKPGDILFSMAGVYLGKTAILRECDTPANTNQAVALIRIIDEKCNREYVYYYLNLPEVVKSVNSITGQSAQPNINLKQIGNIQIMLPERSVQDAVVTILSTYDSLIANNQKQIKLLEEAAQRLYKEWFVDLRFPGHETTPIVDGVPEGWCESTVDDCSCILRRGISPQYNEKGSSIVINQKCIRQSVVDLNEARRQEKVFLPEMNLIDSDTVICSTGAGTLGRVGQIFGQQPNTTFDSHVTLVRASNIVGKQYLYQFLKSKQQYLQGMGKGSTNQLELNRATIQKLVMLVPGAETRDAFERQAQPIHDQITALTKQIVLLQEARDKLLPKLMSGEIEV